MHTLDCDAPNFNLRKCWVFFYLNWGIHWMQIIFSWRWQHPTCDSFSRNNIQFALKYDWTVKTTFLNSPANTTEANIIEMGEQRRNRMSHDENPSTFHFQNTFIYLFRSGEHCWTTISNLRKMQNNFFFFFTLILLILQVFFKMTSNISGYIVLQCNSLDQSNSCLNLNPISRKLEYCFTASGSFDNQWLRQPVKWTAVVTSQSALCPITAQDLSL